MRGGFHPDESLSYSVGAPVFEKGNAYFVFLRNGDWNITPVTNWYHSFFREVEVKGNTLLLNTGGYVVDFREKKF